MSRPGGGIRLRTDRLGLEDSGLESLIEEDVGAGAWPEETSPLRGWRELGDVGNLRCQLSLEGLRKSQYSAYFLRI